MGHVNGHAIDHSVGKGEKSQLDVVLHIGEVGDVEHNRDGGEGLVELGLEREGESLSLEISVTHGVGVLVLNVVGHELMMIVIMMMIIEAENGDSKG